MNTRIRSAFLHQILHFLLAINFALNALLFSSSLFEVVLFDASLFRQLLLQEQAQLFFSLGLDARERGQIRPCPCSLR